MCSFTQSARALLMNLIEMVPLVKDFDRVRDRRTILELARKYQRRQGISVTWHYYVILAKKPQARARARGSAFRSASGS